MATPSLPVKSKFSWKRLAIISLFGGFGIATGLAALIGSVFWYNSRPKQWNTQAVQAHYRQSDSYVALEDWYQKKLASRAASKAPSEIVPKTTTSALWVALLGKTTVQVSYDLENSTDSDYTLPQPDSAGLIAMQKLKSNGSLVDGKGLKWSLAEPLNHLWTAEQKTILIPAHQTVRVVFAIDYDIDDDDAEATAVTDWTNNEVQKHFARHLLKDADAFVLLDENSRYRINLPLQDALR
jgi:hypothetical protein